MPNQNERKSFIVNFISIFLILGVFAISSLILMNIGLRVYKNVVLANENNFELRTSLSYVATKLRQTDTLDGTYLDDKDGVTVLIMKEVIDGIRYETLIYHYSGFLCELFQEEGMGYELDYGTEIMEINEFHMEQLSNGNLKLMATNQAGDSDELVIYLRSRR